jgi:hypothetical protein
MASVFKQRSDKPRRHLGPALLIVLLAGCSVPRPWERVELDDIPAAKFAEIDALPELRRDIGTPMPRYADLGQVEGVSCKRSRKEVASWEDAIRRTKYRAMQKGGNAITDLYCEQPQGRSLTTLCYESVRCTAKAVQVAR